jgi:hypothetical protein
MNKNKSNSPKQIQDILKRLAQFRVLLFLVAISIIYVYIIVRVYTLSNVQPGQNAVASQSTTTQPQINQAIVNQIYQLQGNSVSVQALFNQARQNPFQE